ncbi:MAG TPA: OsmC family protein [Herpetosiphonaceae bacterium]
MSETVSTKSCMTLNLGNYRNFIQEVQNDPAKANFSFSAKTLWKGGTITETTARERVIKADEPEVLGGQDSAVDPVELLLAALSSCVSIGLVTQAAKRGVDFEDFEIEVTGDLDLRGYLGLDESIRSGFTNVQYIVRIKSDAPPEALEEILRAAEKTSPMLDNIRNGVPVTSRLEMID